MPGFDSDSAKRISRSVLYTERLQGIPSTDPNENYAANTSSMCLVRTATTLPAGYSGTMAALGDVVEKQPDGTVTTLGAVWIKDINGGALSANTIYQARLGGTYAQDLTVNGATSSTTLGLYLVQMGGKSDDLLFIRPWRFALVSAELKDKTKTYSICTIFAEQNPDLYETDIYIADSSVYKFSSIYDPINYDSQQIIYLATGILDIIKVDGKATFTYADIEYLPFEICSAFNQFPMVRKSDFELYKDYDSGNHIGSAYQFTRKIKKNPDGSDSVAPVNIYRRSGLNLFSPFVSSKFEPMDAAGNFMTNYVANYNYSKYLGTTINYKKPGPDRVVGYSATGANSTVILRCNDLFGLGYPSALTYSKKTTYLFMAGISGNQGTAIPVQIGQLPNSPMYVAPTSGGISSGIGPGISGV